MFRRLVAFFDSMDGIGYLVQVVVGFCYVAFVATSWLLRWLNEGRYFVAAGVSLVIAVVVFGSIARIPMAIAVLFGGLLRLASSSSGVALTPSCHEALEPMQLVCKPGVAAGAASRRRRRIAAAARTSPAPVTATAHVGRCFSAEPVA